jgi:pimeloyl-ACP methyl ester carboxylesterase
MTSTSELRDDVVDYDEFDALRGYAAYAGIPWQGRPEVRRRSMEVPGAGRVSMLWWGDGPPEVVFVHGGGQNAHTWDTVAMGIDRPSVALDLPGHGHSDWRDDREYHPTTNADTVAFVMEAISPGAVTLLVGMSLGGLTSIRIASAYPALQERLVTVDVTPGVSLRTGTLSLEQRGPTALIGGPPRYDSFEDMLSALAATMPSRPVESLVPGLRHNSRQFDDGSWGWRYDQLRPEPADGEAPEPWDFASLWDDVSAISVPVMLVRGSKSGHVHEDDIAEFRSRQPDVRVEVVDGAGHSVQSDRPAQLAALIDDFVGTT